MRSVSDAGSTSISSNLSSNELDAKKRTYSDSIMEKSEKRWDLDTPAYDMYGKDSNIPQPSPPSTA